MSQTPGGCDCNELAQYTANTGIAHISVANSSLTGSGSTLVLTAALQGTVVRSVTIKATAPVSVGMVRLYINTGAVYTLYKEIPIPVAPALDATPTPTPILRTFELKLEGGLKLQQGFKLYASTQTADPFNVIAEGLDWGYPSPLPDGTCCNYYQEDASTGIVVASAANSNLDGSGTIATLYQAPVQDGAKIKSVTIKALQSTNEGMIRLFVGPNAATFSLMKEIYIPATSQGGFEPSFKQVVELDFDLKAGYVIGASTENAESFALTAEAVSWYYGI